MFKYLLIRLDIRMSVRSMILVTLISAFICCNILQILYESSEIPGRWIDTISLSKILPVLDEHVRKLETERVNNSVNISNRVDICVGRWHRWTARAPVKANRMSLDNKIIVCCFLKLNYRDSNCKQSNSSIKTSMMCDWTKVFFQNCNR